MPARFDTKLWAAAVGVFVVAACSTSSDGRNGQDSGAAGALGTGGTPGEGGAGTGGMSGTGGATGSSVAGTGGARGTGGAKGTGGATPIRAPPGTGGAAPPGGRGGNSGTGGRADAGLGADSAGTGCDSPGLVWKTAAKTEYTSYPDPGSPECIEYNGCEYMGMFAACAKTASEEWVAAHNIVAAFPDFATLKLHDLCLKSGSKTIVVTVIDTCGDSDCDGCCTKNKGSADQLIDIESYTAARFGVPDGRIQWADLGPTQGQACP